MDISEMRERARSFERGAVAYERLRPHFPAELFEAIRDEAGPRLNGRVLEVGAGTGRATVPLARMGALVEVVEPSDDMLAVLTDRLAAAGLGAHASLKRATFEDVGSDSRYDVVVAAQSFHWADPQTRWSRLASLIDPDGRAFLFWNGWQLDPSAHDLAAVEQLYGRHGDGLEPDVGDHRSESSWAVTELAAEPGLALVRTDTYEWSWRLPLADYLGLLSTTSQYAVAPDRSLRQLFDGLADVLGPNVMLTGHTLSLVISPGAAETKRPRTGGGN